MCIKNSPLLGVISRLQLGISPFQFRNNPFQGREIRTTFAVEKAKVGCTSA